MKIKVRIISILILSLIAAGVFALSYIRTSTADFMGIPLGDTPSNYPKFYNNYKNWGYSNWQGDRTRTYKWNKGCDRDLGDGYPSSFCTENREVIILNDHFEHASVKQEFQPEQLDDVIAELIRNFGQPTSDKTKVSDSGSETRILTFPKKNRVLYDITAEILKYSYVPQFRYVKITIKTKKYEQYDKRLSKSMKKLLGI